MFGRVPAYTDISHFRAPYKNAYIAGYGQEEATPPAPPPPPEAPPPAPPADVTPYVVVDPDTGNRTLSKPAKPVLMAQLEKYGTTFVGGEFNAVRIYPYSPEQLKIKEITAYNARAWVENEVKKGNVAYMLIATLAFVLAGEAPPEGLDYIGTWPAGSQQAMDAAKDPNGVVIAGDPAGGWDWERVNPLYVAAAAALVVGGVYYVSTRRRRRRGVPALAM